MCMEGRGGGPHQDNTPGKSLLLSFLHKCSTCVDF